MGGGGGERAAGSPQCLGACMRRCCDGSRRTFNTEVPHCTWKAMRFSKLAALPVCTSFPVNNLWFQLVGAKQLLGTRPRRYERL